MAEITHGPCESCHLIFHKIYYSPKSLFKLVSHEKISGDLFVITIIQTKDISNQTELKQF